MYGIRLENVTLQYGNKTVLDTINAEINPGDFLCLLGPSGSGKSSLLRLLSGLAKPTSGRVLMNEQEIVSPGLDRGVVFQEYSLFPWLSVGENIKLALEQAFPGKSARELKGIAEEFLSLVDLPDVYTKMPGQLSGGMRQRAAIARAFAINPPVLLMDEPFGALDAVTRARLQDLLLDLWQESAQRKTVIFVTHDVEEALLLANRIIVLGLNPGVIRQEFAVNLPRPRQREKIYENETFVSMRTSLINALNREILNELTSKHIVEPMGDKI